MATKIKGVTIELSADTSGLESALKNANKELASTQKQLNSVNKALKLDPGNVDLLEQKQRMLATAIEQTTEKLEALKRAQDQVASSGGAGSQSQYDALTREISETSVNLERLKNDQTAVNAAMQQSQSGTSAFAAGMTRVSSAAGTFADKTRGVSMAAGVALGAMTAMAVNASRQADEWLTLSQQTGLATDSIQKYAYASQSIDVDLSDIVGAITKMKSHLNDSSGIWERIGVNVRNQKGEFRDIEAIFNDAVRAVGAIGNETERDTVAMQLFGRGANELAGLLDDGGEKMRQLGEEAEEMGLIISDEQLQKLGEFDDLLESTKSKLQFAGMAAATSVLEALAPAIQVVCDALVALGDIVSDIPAPIMSAVAIFMVILALMSPVARGIQAVTGALGALSSAVPAVTGAIGQMISAISTFVAGNPMLVAVLAIIAVLALLAIAIYEIVTHWDQISAAGSAAFDNLRSAASSGLTTLKGIGSSIASSFSVIPEVLERVGNAFNSLASQAKSVVEKVTNVFESLKEKARSAGSGIMGKFTEGVESVISRVTQAFQRLAQAIKSVWDSTERDASMAGQRTANAYAQSYNMSANTAVLTRPTASTYGASAYSGMTSSAFTSAINNLAQSMAYQASSPTTVNVELVGSAKNIFDTVRVQNTKLSTATGYHALA